MPDMRGRVLAVYERVPTEIVGPWDKVGRALDTQRRLGRLATDEATVMRRARRLPDGRVSVWVDLNEPRPAPSWLSHHTWAGEVGTALAKACALVAVLGGVMIGALWLLGHVLSGIAEWLGGAFSRNAVGAVGVISLIVWALAALRHRNTCTITVTHRRH